MKFFDWLKPDERPAPKASPEQALSHLATITTDAAIEDVWDEMDQCAAELMPQVRERVLADQFGEYPLHAATIWLAYRLGVVGERAGAALRDRLVESIVWAFGFEDNNVLLGGALGTLGSLAPEDRERVALEVFDALGPNSARRYWLLLKVRTDAFVERAFAALHEFAPSLPPLPDGQPEDPEDPAFIELLEALAPRRRMAGAFRQFTADDLPVLLRHFSLDNAGAEFLVEALAATGSDQVVPLLERAADDPRVAVRRVARAALAR